jgi:hypothetical protein
VGGGATERHGDRGGRSHRRFEVAGEEDGEAAVVVLRDEEDLRDAPQLDNGDGK